MPGTQLGRRTTEVAPSSLLGDAAAPAIEPSGRPAVAGSRRPWVHALALAAVLIGLAFYVGRPVALGDEGASITQAHQLATGQGWVRPDPAPAIDPDHRYFPLVNSTCIDSGCAPLVKHPLYTVTLSFADRVGGVWAEMALSLLGTWLAAVIAMLIGRRFSERVGLASLWVVGAGSPLLFYGFSVVAHTLAAAAAGLAVLCLLRQTERSSWWNVAGMVVAVAISCLLRTECVFVGASLAIVAAAHGWPKIRQRQWRAATVPVLVALATIAAVGADRLATGSALGGASTGGSNTLPTGPDGFPIRQWHGFTSSVLLPGVGLGLAELVPLIAVVLLALAVWWWRRRDDGGPVAVLAALVVAGAIVWLIGRDQVSTVAGLIPALPLLVVGMATARRNLWRDDRIRILVGFALVFSLGVCATQYAVGGGWEWGGRYFAPIVPVAVPAVIVGITRVRGRGSASAWRWVVSAAVVWTIALSVVAVRVAHQGSAGGQAEQRAIHAELVSLRAHTGAPVYAMTDRALVGRMAQDDLDLARWLYAPPDQLTTLLDRLDRIRTGPLLFVGTPDGAKQVQARFGDVRCSPAGPSTACAVPAPPGL